MSSSTDGTLDVLPSAAASANSSKRQIDDLPEELKSEIARHCCEQDKWDRELYRRAFSRALHQRASKPVESLGALFRTSRTWSRVCAPFRFEEITFTQMLADTCRLDVAPRRGMLCRRLCGTLICPSACRGWLEVIKVLPSLPNVSMVDFLLYGDFLDRDFDKVDDHQHAMSSDDVRRVVCAFFARCTHFRFIARCFDGPTRDAISPLPTHPDRPLSIALLLGQSSSLATILKYLAPPRELDSFDLAVECVDADPLLEDDLTSFAWPNLRRLVIRLGYFDGRGDLATRFAGAYRDSLESLDLTFIGRSRPADRLASLPSFTTPSFPRLRLLSISFSDRITTGAIPVLLNSITIERFPAVRSVRLRTGMLGDLRKEAPLFADLAAQPGVVFVHEGPIDA